MCRASVVSVSCTFCTHCLHPLPSPAAVYMSGMREQQSSLREGLLPGPPKLTCARRLWPVCPPFGSPAEERRASPGPPAHSGLRQSNQASHKVLALAGRHTQHRRLDPGARARHCGAARDPDTPGGLGFAVEGLAFRGACLKLLARTAAQPWHAPPGRRARLPS